MSQQPGHAVAQVIDKGASTPADITSEVAIPVPSSGGGFIPIAEFGLAVELDPIVGINNFVTLTGTVAVQSSLFATTTTTRISDIILQVTRRNTTPVSPTFLIFETRQSLLGAGEVVNIGFSFTDGGVDGSVPTGYHAYTLQIGRQDFVDLTEVLTPPTVIGPIQFEGTSYTTNTSLPI